MQEVRAEIEAKRASGKYGVGYEAGIEDPHNSQLGKVPVELNPEVDQLQGELELLRSRIATLSSIERDSAKFAPWRFIRELAMSRHQLIRLNQEVREISESFESIAASIVDSAVTRTRANERAAQELLNLVYERTVTMDKLLVVCREMEERLIKIEDSLPQ